MGAHVIFDLDGTLVDSAGVFADVANDMLAARASSARVTPGMARRYVALGASSMLAQLLGPDCGDVERELEEFRARYAAVPTPESSLFPGAREGLAALLAEGARLSICSNKPQRLCEKVLADLELLGLFDAVVGSEPGAPAKPHAAPFEKVLRLSGAARRDSCLVGDEVVDYDLARGVGVPFVHAAYGYAPSDAPMAGALRADDFATIPPLVRRALSV